MIITEDFKNLTIRELETLSNELNNLHGYKSSRIAELLNELYFVISDVNVEIVTKQKTEYKPDIIIEK